MTEPRLTPAVRRVIGAVVAVLLAVGGWSLYDTSVDTKLNGRLGPPAATTADSSAPSGTSDSPGPSVTVETTDDESGLALVPVYVLPPEVSATLAAIDRGGPFPYDRDGVTFENREGLLPAHDTGYYREYTVDTPGSDDRGARRIITGSAGEFYYTDDHYESFVRIIR